jgi:type II secretory pathway pseudopilin PulG
MIRMLLQKLHRQKGSTMVELVMAIAVGAIIMAAFTTLILNSTRTSQSNNNEVIAIRNLDTAGTWLIRDFQPAQLLPAGVTIGRGNGNITIAQSIVSTNDRSVKYTIGTNGDLYRTADNKTARIAQHIYTMEYTAATGTTASSVILTATVGTATVTKTYETASRITDYNTVLTIVTQATLPGGDVGIPYDTNLSAFGGIKPYSWTIVSGAKPAWATFTSTSSTALINGSNPTLGTSTFTVQVTDSVGATATRTFSLKIVPQPHDITPTTLTAGKKSMAYGPVTFSVSDGTDPKLWEMETGSLPNGLELSLKGILSGTPASNAVSGPFTVTATDGAGASCTSGTLWLTITDADLGVVTTDATNISKSGSTYNATLNGYVTGMGGAGSVIVSFDYGLTTAYGSTTTVTTLGSPSTFSAAITSLAKNTTYHFRAKVVGSTTVYGADLTFTTGS